MVRTRKRFGQHFLEPVWADKVVQAIAPAARDVFLEIGPGTGALTLKLAAVVSRLIAIEIDRDLTSQLARTVPANATVVTADVLEVDLMTLLGDVDASTPVRIAGNLPYNVSSPILFKLLELQSRRSLKDATLMLQREVADRIVAKPGTGDYGVLSVLVQWHADVTRLLALPAGAFRPAPAVKSTLIRLGFRPTQIPLDNPEAFQRLVRSMFSQRRKTLGNALARFGAENAVDARKVLEEAGIDPTRRPETLELVEIAELADLFGRSHR
jgi:16S rRNA (adenine1518-N6/adenine1519-N6)-dimethyltransferase